MKFRVVLDGAGGLKGNQVFATDKKSAIDLARKLFDNLSEPERKLTVATVYEQSEKVIYSLSDSVTAQKQ